MSQQLSPYKNMELKPLTFPQALLHYLDKTQTQFQDGGYSYFSCVHDLTDRNMSTLIKVLDIGRDPAKGDITFYERFFSDWHLDESTGHAHCLFIKQFWKADPAQEDEDRKFLRILLQKGEAKHLRDTNLKGTFLDREILVRIYRELIRQKTNEMATAVAELREMQASGYIGVVEYEAINKALK